MSNGSGKEGIIPLDEEAMEKIEVYFNDINLRIDLAKEIERLNNIINELKKQKDDVVEYIKEIKKHREEGLNITEYKLKWRSIFDYLESDEIIDKVLRMLGEIDE